MTDISKQQPQILSGSNMQTPMKTVPISAFTSSKGELSQVR